MSFMLLALGALSSADDPVGVPYVYKTVGDTELVATAYAPEESAAPPAAVLLFHGGGWRFGSPAWTAGVAKLLASHGATGITVQYRLSKDGVTPADAAEDVCSALAWVRANADDLGIDADRVATYGVSAGGHLSALSGTRGCAETAKPDLMALYSPAIRTSRDGWFKKLLGEGHDVLDHSPLEQVDATTPPSLVVSGQEDTLTPHAYAVDYCERMRASGGECTLLSFPAVGHLLTRNLDNQESEFDVAPESLDIARGVILRWFARHGYVALDD